MKNYYLKTTGIGALCLLSLLIGNVADDASLSKLVAVAITVMLYSAVRALISTVPTGTRFRMKRWLRNRRRTVYYK